jgi:hypothetical protein
MSHPSPAARRLADPPGTLRRVDVERIVAAASRAPSIHNMQPWLWSGIGTTELLGLAACPLSQAVDPYRAAADRRRPADHHRTHESKENQL